MRFRFPCPCPCAYLRRPSLDGTGGGVGVGRVGGGGGIVAITTAATARNFAIARVSALIVRAPRAPAVRWLANISDISSSENVVVLILACPAGCRYGLAWMES